MPKVTRKKKQPRVMVTLTREQEHELLLIIARLSKILADANEGKKVSLTAARRLVRGGIAREICGR